MDQPPPAVTHEALQRQAYILWEAAGFPHGRSEHFWLLAEKILTDSPPAGSADPVSPTPPALVVPSSPELQSTAKKSPARRPKSTLPTLAATDPPAIPGTKAVPKTVGKKPPQSPTKSGAAPAAKPSPEPAGEPAAKTVRKSPSKSAGNRVEKPRAKSAATPAAQPPAKPAIKKTPAPAATPESKTPAAKPPAKSSAKKKTATKSRDS